METANKHILLIDDDQELLTSLEFFLSTKDFITSTCSDLDEALQDLTVNSYDAILLDLNYRLDTTSGMEGLAFLDKLSALNITIPVIAMTGWATVDIAIDAMKRGAKDFVQKPWNNKILLKMINTQIQLNEASKREKRLESENKILKKAIREMTGDKLVYRSSAMTELMEQCQRLATSNMNILILGEHGTGKSLLAKQLHAMSARASEAFIAVNMGAIVDNLFESEMFGHIKGAFTGATEHRIGRFELANGGSLFMDEIANVPLTQQAKLLRVLEEKQFERVGSTKVQDADVRMISATNADMTKVIQNGEFRQDLFYRLNTIQITIPPLRERKEDIVPLAEHFLQKLSGKYVTQLPVLSDAARQAMHQHSWPGNIRELSHSVEKALFVSEGHQIMPKDLGLDLPASPTAEPSTLTEVSRTLGHLHGAATARSEFFTAIGAETCGETAVGSVVDASKNWGRDTSIDDIEKDIIKDRLMQHDGKIQETAQSLGLSRSAFYRRLKKYDL